MLWRVRAHFFQGELTRFTMIPWTTQEISLLIGLWPNASAAQISKHLNRSRASVIAPCFYGIVKPVENCKLDLAGAAFHSEQI